MIKFYNKQNEVIFKFIELYEMAKTSNQKNLDAGCLSTVSVDSLPHSRYVNIKYVDCLNFVFFSNYQSQKAKDISTNNNVALTFFWNTIETQIRIEGKISKIEPEESDRHWKNRSPFKNALAISSNQSEPIDSFDEFKKIYNRVLQKSNLNLRPSYWGGYKIQANYIEFWRGHKNRLNYRELYNLEENSSWKKSILQP